MGQQSRDMMEKYAVASYVIWSAMALIQNSFYFLYQKRFLTGSVGFASASELHWQNRIGNC